MHWLYPCTVFFTFVFTFYYCISVSDLEYFSFCLIQWKTESTGIKWPFHLRRTISVSTQVQGGDFNLYEGLRCHGVPLVTISRGRLVCENGVFMCAEGSGKFYPQRTFPDFLYKKMVQREKVHSLSYQSVTCVLCKSRIKRLKVSSTLKQICQSTRARAVLCCVSWQWSCYWHTHHTVSNYTDLTVHIKDLMLLLPLHADAVFLLLLSAKTSSTQTLQGLVGSVLDTLDGLYCYRKGPTCLIQCAMSETGFFACLCSTGQPPYGTWEPIPAPDIWIFFQSVKVRN